MHSRGEGWERVRKGDRYESWAARGGRKEGRKEGRKGAREEKLCPRDTYRVQIHASRAFTPVSLVIVSREPLHGYSLMGFQAPHDPFHSSLSRFLVEAHFFAFFFPPRVPPAIDARQVSVTCSSNINTFLVRTTYRWPFTPVYCSPACRGYFLSFFFFLVLSFLHDFLLQFCCW